MVIVLIVIPGIAVKNTLNIGDLYLRLLVERFLERRFPPISEAHPQYLHNPVFFSNEWLLVGDEGHVPGHNINGGGAEPP